MKRFLLLNLFTLSILAGEASAAEIAVRFGPPPPPREAVVVRPSPRHAWVDGHYRWAGRRYMWAGGYWTLPPRGRAAWMPGHWDRRDGMHIWVEGRWR